MKRLVVMLIAPCALFFVGLICVAFLISHTTAQVDYAQAKSKALQSDVRELKDTLNKRNAQLKKAQDKVKRLQKRIKELESIKVVHVKATYYTAYCSTGCTGVTALGHDVSDTIRTPQGRRIIAVDPNIIPLGTKVTVVTPYNTFKAVAGDTGGDINGKRIDILVSDLEEAYNKGKVEAVVSWNS